MSCSVLTLNKNRDEHLLNLITGLERNSSKPDELIVVEMGERRNPLPQVSFPIVEVRLTATELLPLAAARNLAVRHASKDTLLFLDVDCIPSEHFVRNLIADVLRYNAIISPEVFYLPERVDLTNANDTYLSEIGASHPVRIFPKSGAVQENNPGLFWSLAFAMRRCTFSMLGEFCEDYIGYGAEDTDFGFKADKHGVRHLLTASCCAFHQYHESMDPPLNHFDDIVANASTFYKRWGKWPMEGWLQAFADRKLIDWRHDHIVVLASPTAMQEQV